jgi:hypothetical protein
MKRLINLVKAGFWTFLLCSPYLFLVANTSLKNDLYINWTQPLKGMSLLPWLANSLGNQMYPNPDVKSSLGASVVIALAVALVIFAFSKSVRTPFNAFCLFGGVGILLLSTSLFPWALTNQTLFSRIQFVWRLNAYTSLLILASFSMLVGMMMPKKMPALKPILLVGLAVCLTISSGSAFATFAKNKAEKTPRDPQIAKLARNIFYGDYSPKQVLDTKNLQQVLQKQYFLNHRPIQPTASYTDSIYTIKVSNTTGKDAILKAPVFWYSYQTVTVNGQPATSKMSAAGTTIVKIPSGEVTVTISYHYPKLLLGFILVALLSLFLLTMSTGPVKKVMTNAPFTKIVH